MLTAENGARQLQRSEYHVERLDFRDITSAVLNDIAKEGWNLVAVQKAPDVGSGPPPAPGWSCLFVFERPFNWPHSDTLRKSDQPRNEPAPFIDDDHNFMPADFTSLSGKTIKAVSYVNDRDHDAMVLTIVTMDDTAVKIISQSSLTFKVRKPSPAR